MQGNAKNECFFRIKLIFLALFCHLNFEIILRNSSGEQNFKKWSCEKNLKFLLIKKKNNVKLDLKLPNCEFYHKKSKYTNDFQ